MDMVGGGPETKAVFHVTRGPMSLPSFVHDVAWAFAEFVNEESYKFAARGKRSIRSSRRRVARSRCARSIRRSRWERSRCVSGFVVRIPAIYLNDWPDRYIHTNFDTAANIDPTKLKRAAFMARLAGISWRGWILRAPRRPQN